MSATYGIRYQCDAPDCTAEAVVWREDGRQPSIHDDAPKGWRRSSYAQTTIKPLHQRPLACPEHAPVIVEAERVYAEWAARRGVIYQMAYGPGKAVLDGWDATNPPPSKGPGWTR